MNNAAVRHQDGIDYPASCPFDPSEPYPEWPDINVSSCPNAVYRQVRNCLVDLKMDEPHLGTPSWSPFSDLIKEGHTVVIKPNLVFNTSKEKLQEYTTSHPSVIRPIIDYCWKALNGKGAIIIGDAPSAEADFDEIVRRSKLRELVDAMKARGVNVTLMDFRSLKVSTENGIWTKEVSKKGEHARASIVNLGRESLFYNKARKKAKLHGAGYDIRQTSKHHHHDIQEYSVSETILTADLVISVPKFKTHRKAGITCCLKNLVGINTDKNFLPHFTMGSRNMGGDEMPDIPEKNIGKMKAYNLFREYVLAYTWRIIGRLGVKVLRFAKNRTSQKEDTNRAAMTAADNGAAANAERDNDYAAWLHKKISGQKIAAGAWPGNETICKMILDLNKIFLCCNKDGILSDDNKRKVFYIVDAVKIGMGSGPTSPAPYDAGVIAAGYNGFQIDTCLMQCFGIDHNDIPLYKMASAQKWLTNDSNGRYVFNGDESAGKDRVIGKILPPDSWEF
jgi:uncharacterized protein (DUF362 family)